MRALPLPSLDNMNSGTMSATAGLGLGRMSNDTITRIEEKHAASGITLHGGSLGRPVRVVALPGLRVEKGNSSVAFINEYYFPSLRAAAQGGMPCTLRVNVWLEGYGDLSQRANR